MRQSIANIKLWDKQSIKNLIQIYLKLAMRSREGDFMKYLSDTTLRIRRNSHKI